MQSSSNNNQTLSLSEEEIPLTRPHSLILVYKVVKCKSNSNSTIITSNKVNYGGFIRLSQRLSHACLSINKSIL